MFAQAKLPNTGSVKGMATQLHARAELPNSGSIRGTTKNKKSLIFAKKESKRRERKMQANDLAEHALDLILFDDLNFPPPKALI